MSQSLYEVIALGARYLFAALMALIVFRAWRITLTDSRRAAVLRRLSPQTGLSGELVVLEGDGKARPGMRYPVIREGAIGTSRGADIRVRGGSVRRRHADFQLTEDGLRVRAHAGAAMRDGDGHPARALTLADGDSLYLGDVKLLLVLSAAPDVPIPRRSDDRRAPADDSPSGDLHQDDFPEDGFDAPDERPSRPARRPAEARPAQDAREAGTASRGGRAPERPPREDQRRRRPPRRRPGAGDPRRAQAADARPTRDDPAPDVSSSNGYEYDPDEDPLFRIDSTPPESWAGRKERRQRLNRHIDVNDFFDDPPGKP